MKPETALYYYPTNVVLIDDNQAFLSALSQSLYLTSPHLQHDTYSNPVEALEKINASYIQWQQQQLTHPDPDQENASQFVFDVLNKGAQLKGNQQDADEISVLVVDLEMPGIDGIEFCKKIQSPNIKKILLTGTTETERVLTAFNNDDIHFYISKAHDNMDVLLEQAIARLKYEYFLDISSKIKSEAISGSATLLSDPAFAQHFSQLHQTLNIKAFYFEPAPARYRLELMDGSTSLLLVYSEEDIQEHLQVMQEERAPEHLMKAISNGHVPYFTTADGFYEAQHPDADSWKVYSANIVEGRQPYFCALLHHDLPSSHRVIIAPSSNSVH